MELHLMKLKNKQTLTFEKIIKKANRVKIDSLFLYTSNLFNPEIQINHSTVLNISPNFLPNVEYSNHK